jgi:HK97 family phage major capsid protein
MKAARKVSSFDMALRNRCDNAFMGSRYLELVNQELEAEQRSTIAFDKLTEGGYFATGPAVMDGVLQAIDSELNFQSLCTVLHNVPLAGLGAMELTTDVSDATWGAELGAYTESAPRTGMRMLKPAFHRVLVKAGVSMLEAARFDLEAYIYKRIAYKMGVPAETAFMTGNGQNQPLGIFTANANGISTGRDRATATANTFKADDLWSAYFDLKTAHANKSTWVFSRTVMSEIRKMKDTAGQYVWNPTGNLGDALVNGSPATVCGRPYMVSEYANAYSTTTGTYVAVLGNFKDGYVVAWAEDMRIVAARELHIATDEVGYYAKAAMDAQPVLEEAFARVKIS